jgi:hypothetical protein
VSTIALDLPLGQLQSTGSLPTAGPGLLTIILIDGSTGGWRTLSIPTPYDLDRSRPADLDLYHYRGAFPTPTVDQVIRLQTQIVIRSLDTTIQTIDVTESVTIPANSGPQVLQLTTLGNGASIIPAGTIPKGSVLGVRILRLGADAADTYTTSRNFLSTVRLRYTRLCNFWGCF